MPGFSAIHGENVPALVEYSALLRTRDQPSPARTADSTARFLVIDIAPSDGLSAVLESIRTHVLSPPFLVNEREVVVQRLDHIQLVAVWALGGCTGHGVLCDDGTLRRSLIVMGRRGWVDNLAVRVNDPFENILEATVPMEMKREDDGDWDESDEGSDHKREVKASTERLTLSDGGALV